MYFETKNGPVYEPANPILNSLYKVLKKNAPVLDGSRVFEDLVETYEALVADLKEEK
ncbi:hypothetical protein NST77_23065 [Niallia sp. FSL W8-0177]|uniref:hypothetical protein n=1 Tax=Niallia TaxID=2837506 RepID=UPI002E250768|nr:hypothetical protein [Niallia circulans]